MELTSKKGKMSEEMSYSCDGEEFGKPRILVVGCGEAGCKMVTRLANMGASGAEILAVKTDGSRTAGIRADKKILIGEVVVGGDGARVDPDAGRMAVEGSRRALEEALGGADLVFVASGPGGGAGGGAAQAVCQMARDLGKMAVAIFTLPPRADERGGGSPPIVPQDIEGLVKAANTLILLDIERVFEMAPNLSMDQALSVMDQLVAEIIKGIAETVTETSLINLDYADLKTIISNGGLSAVLVGESDSEEGAEEIVRSALISPLVDVDTKGATGCLLHITGGCDLTLKKAAAVASVLTGEMGPGANVIWGARVKEGFEGKIRLMAIMTGVGFPYASGQQEIPPGP